MVLKKIKLKQVGVNCSLGLPFIKYVEFNLYTHFACFKLCVNDDMTMESN